MDKNKNDLHKTFLNITEEEIIIIFLQKKYDLLVSKIEDFNNIMKQNITIDRNISQKDYKYNNIGVNENNIIFFSNLIKKNIALFEIQLIN
jgi:hypothetical protein